MTPAELEPWAMEFGGLVLGGSSPIVIEEVSGLADLPDVRSNDTELIAYEGLWPGYDWQGGRSIDVMATVNAYSHQELSDVMALVYSALRSTHEEQRLRFRIPGVAQGVEAYVRARLRKRESPIGRRWAAGAPALNMQFVCTDPRIYPVDGPAGRITREMYRGLGASEGGAPSPLVFDAHSGLFIPDDSSAGGSRDAYCRNGSLVARPCTITAYGPMNGVRIRNVTTGAFVGVSALKVEAGQWLSFTANAARDEWVITLGEANGGATEVPRTRWDQGSQFWQLPPGVTQLALSEANENENTQKRAGVSWTPGPFS
ncbi:hypothetical protein ACIQU6_29090 [Streptomyces sp. NPDC090442]|uniref:hypothetical protein n=1 Tax=Streptomyces sp. NPDC090442 TaxID=3365962 RepID=UPI00380D5EDC